MRFLLKISKIDISSHVSMPKYFYLTYCQKISFSPDSQTEISLKAWHFSENYASIGNTITMLAKIR